MPKGVWKNGLKPVPPSRKGAKLSDAHKQRLIEAVTGNTWSRGKVLSEQTKSLMRENSARYWLGKKRGPQSAETKEKRSKSLTGLKRPYVRERMLTNNPNKGKFGSNHPGWVEEKKRPLYKAIRGLHQYKEWRMTVFTRDGFTCVLCQTKGYVEADHFPTRFVDILRKHEIKDIESAIDCTELWNNSNGRTLCKPCHLQTLTWGKKPDSKRV